jgi:putative MATE family efflux protein
MQDPKRHALDSDKIGSLLFKLALPAFIGMFVTTLYNVVNTIFIGHYIGYLGIAGLSIVFPFQMLGLGLGQMTGVGGASLISRLLGTKNVNRAERALGNALVINVAVALLMTGVGLSNPDYWLRLAGASENVLPYARDYMEIIFAGMIFNNLTVAAASLTIAQGNSRIPMIAMVIGAVLNIILDAVFIISMGMGVRGAAIGTVISQMVSTIFFISYYFSGRSYLKIRLRNLVPEINIFKQIMAIGVSLLALTLTNSVSHIIVNRMLENYGSDMALSVIGVLGRLMMFAIMPGIVIGQGLQPIVGYNYGANRFDRIIKGIKIGITSVMVIGLLVFFVVYFSPSPLIRIFTDDPELIAQASHAARRTFFFMYLVGFISVGSMVFVAIGKATRSFITSISRSILFLIPSLFILSHFWHLDGIWMAFPVADFLAFCLMLVLIIPQIKQFMRKQAAEDMRISPALSPAEEDAGRN